MRMRLLRGVLLAGLAVGLSGCGKPSVLAAVGRNQITLKEFENRISKLPEPYQQMARSRPRAFLEDWITELLLLEEAKRRGLERQQIVRELAEEARKKILVARLVDDEADLKISVTDEEIQKFYEENKKGYAMPERFRARHILVENEAKASEILSRIKSGGDFAKIAQAESQDPSRARGGDIGTFSRGQLIKEFEDAVTSLEVGQMSGVVRTTIGYHIIQLIEKLPARTLSVDEVRDQIVQDLRAEKKRGAVIALAESLRKRAKITVREDLLTSVQKAPDAPVAAESSSPSASPEASSSTPNSP